MFFKVVYVGVYFGSIMGIVGEGEFFLVGLLI